MRLTYPLRVLFGTVQPDVNDNPIILPPTLQPVVEFPGVLKVSSVGSSAASATETQDTIISANRFITAPSSGSTYNAVVTLSAGLWRIDVNFCFLADFAEPIAGAPTIGTSDGVELFNPQGQFTFLFVHSFIANTPLVVSFTRYLNLAADNFSVGYRNTVTGVGQNAQATLSVAASRLG